MNQKHALRVGLVAVSLAVVACGGSSSSGAGKAASSGTGASTSPAAAASGPAKVSLANSSLGSILVDGSGRTLYLFANDTGTTSTCYGSCASAWPPLLTDGAPDAGSGVNTGLVGTTKRTDGTTEVTYNGHPLYYWVGDKKPGDVTGQGINNSGGVWYVLNASGDKVTG
ncbi:MAG: hypothetical protein J2P45_28270 [Candidatus Dormibacteraeota bacterium]|nr:hypothetical protein [Candidatus Dormibacteraeota bacterium]